MDVVRALYLDQTGQAVPESVPLENTLWMIEDYDFISSYNYMKEGSLSFWGWLKSFRGLREAKWFSWKDPMPFLKMLAQLLKYAGGAVLREVRHTGEGSPGIAP